MRRENKNGVLLVVMGYLNLRSKTNLRMQKYLDIDSSRKDNGTCWKTDQRRVEMEDTREVDLTKRQTSRDAVDWCRTVNRFVGAVTGICLLS